MLRLEADTVRIFVSDLDRSIPFYRDALGLRLELDRRPGGVAIFGAGGLRLIVERADEQELVGRFVGLSFRVESVTEAFHELARRGVPFDGEPERQSWGGTLAHLRDPDGNVLTLVGEP